MDKLEKRLGSLLRRVTGRTRREQTSREGDERVPEGMEETRDRKKKRKGMFRRRSKKTQTPPETRTQSMPSLVIGKVAGPLEGLGPVEGPWATPFKKGVEVPLELEDDVSCKLREDVSLMGLELKDDGDEPEEAKAVEKARASLSRLASIRLLQLNADQKQEEMAVAPRKEKTVDQTSPKWADEVPFIDTEAAAATSSSGLPSDYGTECSFMSSLPQLSRRDERSKEMGSRESGYTSSLSLSPIDHHASCEGLTERGSRSLRGKYRQKWEEGVNCKERCRGMERAATTDQLSVTDEVDRFLRDSVYKTKYVTCVFEARDGGLEEIVEDSVDEMKRWLGKERMVVAAVEVHFSVPVDRRQRKMETRLKTSLLSCLRDNNQRILNLRRGTRAAPIEVVESRTLEVIDNNRELDTVQGVYQRSYGRLLRHAHSETPAWHRPYWLLEGAGPTRSRPQGPDWLLEESVKPRPQQFLFGADERSLSVTSLLKLSARNVPSATETSRVMRVEVERGVKRRRAEFDKSSPLVFPLRRSSIGRVAAVPHGRPLFYYLMPTCSPLTRLFSIDREFGELMFSSKEEIPLSRVSLCVYVSPDSSEDVSSLAFDPSRHDMLSLLISAPSSNPSISHPDLANLNNTVQIIDPSLESIRVPVQSSFSPFNYSISDVQFTPADNVRPTVLPLAPPLSLFRVDDQGQIRVSPAISTQPHGVYRVDMDVDVGEESMKLQKEFHLVSKSDQMRFVFDIPPSQLSMQMEDFKRELRDAMSVDHPETKMEVAVEKEADVVRNNQNRSSLCFHVLRNSVVLPGASSVMSVSEGREESHSRLAALYQAFHVVDIEDCLAAPTPTASSSAFSALLSSYTLLLCLLSLLSLILFSLIVYFCFVRRYRMQVQRKIKDLHASRPPRPIELNAPTFVLAPATLPPPSSLGYWDP